MILYRLRCTKEHEFEAWFRDGATFDRQSRQGSVECPYCGTVEITKAPMAPHISTGGRAEDVNETRARALAQDILKAVHTLRERVEKECDYVGDSFTEEARRIHYGETKERGIYGEATVEEAKDLGEEGIEVYRLPGRLRRDG